MDNQNFDILKQQVEAAAIASTTAKTTAEANATAAETAKTTATTHAADAEIAKNAAATAKTEIETIKTDATNALAAALKAQKEAENHAIEAQKKLAETIKTLEKSITASLGGAFAEKERESRSRDKWWLCLLTVSVVSLWWIGSARYEQISNLIANKATAEQFLVQALFGLSTLSAPIWLAWLATKRLSKTYAISEDYAYKSAVAQAYQGYRDSVKDGDEQMRLRLFATVITQLDATPVRFISNQHPGTPWQDLMNQPWMQDILKDETIRAKFNNWMKDRFSKVFDIPIK
jgi:hypothetical protein